MNALAAGILPLLLLATSAHAQAPRMVRLWSAKTTANLENENQLSALCPKTLEAAALERCKKEKLAPKSWNVPLRAEPDLKSEDLGRFVVTATPGKGLSYSYKGAEFTPDLFDADWGYGPYADQTALDRKGNWVLLPKRPFPSPVWADLSALGGAPDVYDALEEGTVYQLDGRSVTLKKLEKDGALLRDEIPGDMPCGEEESAAKTPEPKAKRYSWRELHDADGHLKLKKTYLRGC